MSTESSYQRYYESVASKFNISCLEADIRDVVDTVESHQNEKRDKKINTILTALSVLAIFSILIDGINLADRIESNTSFGFLQWGVIGIVVLFISIYILIMHKK